MKLSSLLCAAFVSLAALAPVTVKADPYCGERTRVTYDHCGRPIYWTYTCVGRDHCGRHIFRWVQTSRGGHGGGYSGHGGGYGGGHGGYDHGHGGHGRSGFSIRWSR